MVEIDVYDLDETLLRGNSTRLYLGALLRVAIRHGQVVTALRAAGAAALRGARLTSHRRFKWQLWHARAGLSQWAAANFRHEFARGFVKMLRPSMVNALTASRRAGRHILVATAGYAEVPRLLRTRIDGVVGTETAAARSFKEYAECRGAEKADRVRRYAEALGGVVATIYTDGADDGPLLAAFPEARRCIVGHDD